MGSPLNSNVPEGRSEKSNNSIKLGYWEFYFLNFIACNDFQPNMYNKISHKIDTFQIWQNSQCLEFYFIFLRNKSQIICQVKHFGFPTM